MHYVILFIFGFLLTGNFLLIKEFHQTKDIYANPKIEWNKLSLFIEFCCVMYLAYYYFGY